MAVSGHGSTRRGYWCLAYSFLLASLTTCSPFKTNAVVKAFNEGALDTSSGDPFHSPEQVAVELVTARIRQELSDGYFGQGLASPPYVAEWMQQGAVRSCDFTDQAYAIACREGTLAGRPCASARGARVCQHRESGVPDQSEEPRVGLRRFARELSEATPGMGPLQESACGSRGAEVERRFADFVRFETAVARAVRAAAALVGEGLANYDQVHLGADQAFRDAAQYLRDRRWTRQLGRRTTALVVKGGASTGVFSAGAVWVVLNVINECMKDCECSEKQRDWRLEMMSGTSTGALVSTVVDFFNTRANYLDRRHEINRLANWFACSSMNDLYCVRSHPVFSLARDDDSLLDFDGITTKLRQNVQCAQLTNVSELIFNTVDFRSGRLFGLSDQERFSIRSPEDVVQAALASAVLPVIARPVYGLPANYSARERQAYVDGGIRSELPIMPVVRRGAERVLVVGSSSSVPGEMGRIDNALQLAARYIDISVAGLIETELAQSQTYVRAIRLAENDACADELSDEFAAVCGSGCDDVALCEGRWGDVCDVKQRPALRFKPTDAQRLKPVWQMITVFRDEKRVEPLHGYTFDPEEQRRLFLAGAEAARLACLPIGRLLGVVRDRTDHGNEGLRRKLAAWCAPALAPDVCGPPGPPGAEPSPTPKDCKAAAVDPPPAELLQDCRPMGGAP
jgi:predicted acylesterase/phospholipase RssA